MANKTLSDFPVLSNLDAASVAHVQKELVDYQVTLPVLTEYVAENAALSTIGSRINGANEKTDPVDADMVGLMDSAASNVLKKFSWANFKAKLKTYFDSLYPSVNGWVSLGLTMTYASADAPTFTATVPGDVTGVLSAGMKLKLTQTTVKYFILTAAPSYSSGTGLTTLTFYGGTDYTLVNAAISNVYYSVMKAPYGFPMNPAKWTVEVTDTSNRSKSSPNESTWYYSDLGSINIYIPIGCWNVEYDVCVTASSSGNIYLTTALSTSNSSVSDTQLRGHSGASGMLRGAHRKSKIISVAEKTQYFLIGNESNASTSFGFLNSTGAPCVIRAQCAYL